MPPRRESGTAGACRHSDRLLPPRPDRVIHLYLPRNGFNAGCKGVPAPGQRPNHRLNSPALTGASANSTVDISPTRRAIGRLSARFHRLGALLRIPTRMNYTPRAAVTLLLAFATVTRSWAADDVLFRDKVAPILETRCVRCHGDLAPKGGLNLTTLSELLEGGETGPAVVPNKPDESVLLDKISGNLPEMPLKEKPLSAAEVAGIRAWIEHGAEWPAGLVLHDRRLEGQRWWAFEPISRPEAPRVKNRGWTRTPIDPFILSELERHGLRPSAEADRRTLIRRLSFDLLGLPPAPDEIDAFVGDSSPAAYESLVDRLLASPHYGERWGRHWLDVVHYGDTHGYDKDKRRDHAWPYRDYVIGSFNTDVPYGRFIREQVAGDVIWPGEARGIIATGFIAAGPWDFVGHVELREGTVEKLKTRVLDRDDMVSSTMATFVSMTAHCARCHDHKFDPITQRDYYRLQAVFAGVDRGDRQYQSGEPAMALRSWEQARAIREKLVAAQPEVTQYQVDLARTYMNLGVLQSASGQPAAALKYYEQGLAILKPLASKHPQDALLRSRLINLRSIRLITLAYFGQHDQATAEADMVAQEKSLSRDNHYNLACVFSVASAAVHKDERLSPAERDQRSEQHAARAFELLTKSQAAGFFALRGNVETMKRDKDLEPLRCARISRSCCGKSRRRLNRPRDIQRMEKSKENDEELQRVLGVGTAINHNSAS